LSIFGAFTGFLRICTVVNFDANLIPRNWFRREFFMAKKKAKGKDGGKKKGGKKKGGKKKGGKKKGK
jgi:hypothetical protein